MSGLTKLFVGLLVVLSIVLSAATVATVATLDNFVSDRDAAQSQIASLQAEASEAANALSELQTASSNREGVLRSQLTKVRGDYEALRNTNLGLQAEVTSLKGTITQENTNQLTAVQALNASQQTVQALQDQVSTLTGELDRLTTENVDLNTEVGNLVAQNQVTERERRNLAEQLREVQQRVSRLGRAVEDAGLDSEVVASGRQRVQGNPPAINGVVKELRTLGSQTVATISVGRNDDVTEGTEFKIVDSATGAFLGLVTVQYVDADEAVGYLSGPGVAQVSEGDEVLTQFRS